MNYFENKEAMSKRALFVTKYRAREYACEIENCISHTVIFDDNIMKKCRILSKDTNRIHTPKTMVVQEDSVSAIFKYTTDNERVAVLNFASYKNPGGMFINGSTAQEESLCHASILYNVLSSQALESYYAINNGDKNRGLYHNRALYTESVVFFDNTKKFDRVGEMRLIDVITCAAPNAGCFLRYNTGEGAEALNNHILEDRIKFVHEICEYAVIKYNLETVILGAWGCGVFKQNPATVASMMANEFKSTRLNKVIFGIPDENTYNIFKNIIK